MKLKVLVDNYTFIDEYYFGEPALCFYIEDGDSKILLDTGYSDVFMANAEKMGIDLEKVDTIVFSHGHNDHTRGFKYYVDEYGPREDDNSCEKAKQQVKVVAHPLCFNKKRELMPDGHIDDMSAPFDISEMEKLCQLNLTKDPTWISDNIVYLGEIPDTFDFERRYAVGQYYIGEGQGCCNEDYNNKELWPEDKCYDDSALAYKSKDGIFIITGCSHSGICNIIEHAKKVCEDERVIGVIGGFHLFDNNERLAKTIKYFKDNNIEKLYPCHCVSFHAKAAINEVMKIGEVGVNFTLEI